MEKGEPLGPIAPLQQDGSLLLLLSILELLQGCQVR